MAESDVHLVNKELPAEVVEDVQKLLARRDCADFTRLLRIYGLFPLYRGYTFFEVEDKVFLRVHRPPILETTFSSNGAGFRANLVNLVRPLDSFTAEVGVFPRAKGLAVALDSFKTRIEYKFSSRNPKLRPRGEMVFFNRNSLRMREWEILPRSYRKGFRWRLPSSPCLSAYHKETHKDMQKMQIDGVTMHPHAFVLRAAGPFAYRSLFGSFDAKLKVDFARQTSARCTLSGISQWQGAWPFVNYVRLQRVVVLSSRADLVPRRSKKVYDFEGDNQRTRGLVGGLAELGWRIPGSRPVSMFGFCSAFGSLDGGVKSSWGAGVRVEVTRKFAVELLMRATPTLYGAFPLVAKFNLSD